MSSGFRRLRQAVINLVENKAELFQQWSDDRFNISRKFVRHAARSP
jgi:hypothetical protein